MTRENELPIVVAITGASGAMYAIGLLRSLLKFCERPIHLTISPSGAAVLQQETELRLSLINLDVDALVGYRPDWSDAAEMKGVDREAIRSRIHYHHYQDYMTPIASGSFRTAGMIVCPCSGSTLSGIARAAGSNLIQRAAEVHLKERRRLVLVPRETPLSTFALENMHRISSAGGIVLPAMPGWYHGVTTLDSLIDFVVARILDQFEIDNDLMQRWKAED